MIKPLETWHCSGDYKGIPKDVRLKIYERQDHLCHFCATKILNPFSAELHHKRPRCAGGSDDPENLCLCHPECHKKHHNRHRAKRKRKRERARKREREKGAKRERESRDVKFHVSTPGLHGRATDVKK